MSRMRLMWDAIYPTLVLWVVLIAVAFWRDATWPSSQIWWEIFLAVCFMVEFFILKALLMARRMVDWKWLTVSLICSNASLAVVFSVLISFGLWMGFFIVRHRELTLWILRIMVYGMVAVLIFACWQLMNAPPPALLNKDDEATIDGGPP